MHKPKKIATTKSHSNIVAFPKVPQYVLKKISPTEWNVRYVKHSRPLAFEKTFRSRAAAERWVQQIIDNLES